MLINNQQFPSSHLKMLTHFKFWVKFMQNSKTEIRQKEHLDYFYTEQIE